MTLFLSSIWAVLRNTLLPREGSIFLLLVRFPPGFSQVVVGKKKHQEKARPSSPAAKLLYIHY